jgi:glucokinase
MPKTCTDSLIEQVSTSSEYVLGVDIGGTKVAAGLIDASGSILHQQRVPMVSNSTAAAGLQSVLSAINSVMAFMDSGQKVRAIGICAPGPLDPVTGVILNPPNVPCWRNFPLASEIAAVHHVPVKVDNDANSAALAETRWGAGREFSNIFYATLGTGIGTGIILDSNIYHGRTGSAGEGGHISIDVHGPICSCGKPGCIEVFASGPAIARRARAKLAHVGSSASPLLLQLAGGNPEAITTEMIGRASAAGDACAREILRETVDLLLLWLGNMVDLLDPEAIIIGGGAAAVLLPFFDDMRRELPRYCVNPRANEVALLPAHYGADSGIAGGAALCYNTSRSNSQLK